MRVLISGTVLEQRKAAVLRALVEEHIQTSGPVSSRAVLERSGLEISSATVRNDLVILEQEGYVRQPHTSAGRIPTSKAYRYFVDHMVRPRLLAATRGRVHEFFSLVHHELGRMLQDTSDFLADLAHYPAVVLGPGLMGETMRGVHLIQLGPQVFLVVLVTDAGRVSQELVRLAIPLDPEDLAGAERFVNQGLRDRPVNAAIEMASSDPELPEPVGAVVRAVAEVAARSQHASRQIYLGGTSQLASLWEDLAELHQVLGLLEREALLLRLMEQSDEGTWVRIGSELPVSEQVDLAVVAASYDVAGRPAGRVGVLGPMRMDYGRAVSIVEEVSEGLAESLGS